MHHVTGVPIVEADRADGCAAAQGAACLGHRKWNLPTRQLLIPDPDGVVSRTHSHFNTPRPANLSPPSTCLPNTPLLLKEHRHTCGGDGGKTGAGSPPSGNRGRRRETREAGSLIRSDVQRSGFNRSNVFHIFVFYRRCNGASDDPLTEPSPHHTPEKNGGGSQTVSLGTEVVLACHGVGSGMIW